MRKNAIIIVSIVSAQKGADFERYKIDTIHKK